MVKHLRFVVNAEKNIVKSPEWSQPLAEKGCPRDQPEFEPTERNMEGVICALALTKPVSWRKKASKGCIVWGC